MRFSIVSSLVYFFVLSSGVFHRDRGHVGDSTSSFLQVVNRSCYRKWRQDEMVEVVEDLHDDLAWKVLTPWFVKVSKTVAMVIASYFLISQSENTS